MCDWAMQPLQLAIPENFQTGRGVEDILFDKPPGIFHFFTLPLEIPDKTKLNPWIFHKIVIDSLEIHIIFSWSPLQIPPHF